ncbi:MAG TPA: hypothetical protein VKT29_07575 [Terriglobales bacterium]|nr:hypothetical protein [Terriglobales bacterium]
MRLLMRSQTKWAMTALLLPALAATVFLAHHRAPQPRMDMLLGVWTTNDPPYAGRHFEIRKDLIVVAFNDDTAYTESITAVEADPHDGGISFKIHTTSYGTTYRPEDEHPALWQLEYKPADGGTIRIAHQPKVIWKKAKVSGE